MNERDNLQVSYDRVADEYVQRIYDELRQKPLDRALLDRFAASVRSAGLVCDMGCGPGQVARYLFDQGVQVCGVDLSLEMVRRARELNPGIEFHQGDMLSLEESDNTWAGITAFYSIIHFPAANRLQALRELGRVLRPAGQLLISFHVGEHTIHLDELWGHPVCVDFYYLRPDAVAGDLAAAGFQVEEIIERDPYPEIEHQSRRAYVFATKISCTAGSATDGREERGLGK